MGGGRGDQGQGLDTTRHNPTRAPRETAGGTGECGESLIRHTGHCALDHRSPREVTTRPPTRPPPAAWVRARAAAGALATPLSHASFSLASLPVFSTCPSDLHYAARDPMPAPDASAPPSGQRPQPPERLPRQPQALPGIRGFPEMRPEIRPEIRHAIPGIAGFPSGARMWRPSAPTSG